MNEALRKPKSAAGQTARTASREVRRQQLIEATITAIARHGIGGTTLSTVTELAGLSIGIVNFHFKSKQKLFEDTLSHLAREHFEHWQQAYRDAGPDPARQLAAIADAHFDAKVCSAKKLAVWCAFYGEAGRRTLYRALVDHIDDQRLDLVTDLCQAIADQGGHTGPPPDRIAYTLEGLFDGLGLNMLMYPEEFTREQARDHVRGYLATVFPRHFDMPAG